MIDFSFFIVKETGIVAAVFTDEIKRNPNKYLSYEENEEITFIKATVKIQFFTLPQLKLRLKPNERKITLN